MPKSHSQIVEESRKKRQIVEIKLRVPLTEKEKIWAHATSQGKTLAGYIKDVISEDMAKEK